MPAPRPAPWRWSYARRGANLSDMPYDPPDVSPAVAELQARRYRAMTPARKLALADGLWDLAWEAARAGVRMRHPELDAPAVERTARAILRRASE